MKKNAVKKNILIYYLQEKEKKKHYVFIKDFNTFMYDHSLHRGRKHLYRYCLHAFIKEEILKRHIKDCFKINGDKELSCLRKVNMFNSKILKEKQNYHL